MTETFDGRCTCGTVQYRMTHQPLYIHCCHCTWCQRETGAAFALNAMVEAGNVEITAGNPEPVLTPSSSGKGQKITRCPTCRIALWSNYSSAGDAIRFVRVGTLANPGQFPPDVHIFTETKQPWVQLNPATPAFDTFYDRDALWPESLRTRLHEAKRMRPA